MRAWASLVVASLVMAGCTGDDPAAGREEGGAEGTDPIGTPIVAEHDHNDVSLHTSSHGLAQVAWSTLGVELGRNGFANFVLHEDDDEKLAFVAVDGDTDGGFVIADVSDPGAIQVLGRYWISGSGMQEVRVTPDGDTALLNVQEIPAAPGVGSVGAPDCTVCLHVVDVSERSAPRLMQVMPVELLGTHNMHIEAYDEGLHVFYVGQPLNLPFPDPGNHVWIARLLETPDGPRLVPVSSLDQNDPQREGRSFPHDVLVQDHPSGRKVAYVSHWDGGLVLFDVTDPLLPQKLAVLDDPAPGGPLAVHWAMQEAAPRDDGRVVAWSAPEIGVLEDGTGFIRTYDVTDPAAPAQLGVWTIPGDAWIPGQYILSPHTAVPGPDGRVAVAHYHAGVWVLDGSDPAAPEALAYYLPHGDEEDPYDGPLWWKKPNFDPEGYGPNTYMARWDPDAPQRLWVTDRGTGLYLLELTV